MTPRYPHRYPTRTQIMLFAFTLSILLIATLLLVNGGNK